MPPAYIPVFLYSLFLMLILIAVFFLLKRRPAQSERDAATRDPHSDRSKFSADYCLIAMIYVIAAVQAVFLFSWTILFRAWLAAHVGVDALIFLFVFVAVLSVGYIWLYKKMLLTGA